MAQIVYIFLKKKRNKKGEEEENERHGKQIVHIDNGGWGNFLSS